MKIVSIIILLSGIVVNGALAQLIKVDQEVFGMDCAPCAYGLERGLKKMDGLKTIKVSLNDGKAYVSLAANNDLTLQKIQEEVKNNGFSARNAEVTLKGKLLQQGNNWLIEMNNETFRINPDKDDAIIASLHPGIIKVKGIVTDEEDNQLDDTWNIQVTELIDTDY